MIKFRNYTLYCVVVGVTLSCAIPKKVSEDKNLGYLFWIRKKPEGKKFIDYEDEYWLLKHTNVTDIRNIKIDSDYYTPYYVAFDLTQNVSICCRDPSFEDNLRLEKSEYKPVYSDEVTQGQSFNFKYLDYVIKVFLVNGQDFCTCTKSYSGLTSEVVTRYAYPAEGLSFFSISRKERKAITDNITSILEHPEVFGSDP